MSIYTWISALSPIIGKSIDSLYAQCELFTLSIGITGTISMISLMAVDPTIGYIFFGLCNCQRTAITFPIVSKFVDARHVNVANGLLKSVENLLGCFLTALCGVIY